MEAAKIQYLQKILSERLREVPPGFHANDLALNHHIGYRERGRIVYTDAHFGMAEALLATLGRSVGNPEGKKTPRRRGKESTAGAPTPAPTESACYPGFVMAKAASETLEHDGLVLPAGPGIAVMVEADRLAAMAPDLVIVVESLEALRQFERFPWARPDQRHAVAVYRGDHVFPVSSVDRVIRQARSVWACSSFDPAGLLMCEEIHRTAPVARVALPPVGALQAACEAHAPESDARFSGQAARLSSSLSRARHPEVRTLWGVMQQMRRAVPMELLATSSRM